MRANSRETGVKVTYDTDPNALSLDTVQTATLTTQHAASSYGVPVLVTEGGAALGPAEAPPLQVTRQTPWPEHEMDASDEDHDKGITDAHRDLIARAIAAGYRIS